MLVSSIFVARMLGAEGFGQLGMVRSTVDMFGVFAGIGLGVTATKHVAQFYKNDPLRAGRIIAMSGLVAWLTGGFMAIVLVVTAPWLAAHSLAAPQLGGLLQVGGLLLLLSALNGAQTGALAGFEAFKTIAQVNLFVGVASFPILLAGAYLGGLHGEVWALVATWTINWLLNHMALRRESLRAGVSYGLTGCLQESDILWRFSLPAALCGMVVGPVNWGCCSMLVNQPNGYLEMGAFNAANQWFGALLFLPGLLSAAVLPMFSQLQANHQRRQSRNLLWLSMTLIALTVLPIVAAGCLASPYIMAAYSKEFSGHPHLLVMVLVTAGLLAVQMPVGQLLTATGRLWTMASINLAWAVSFFVLTYVLLPWGALGLATARALAYLACGLWTVALTLRVVGRPTT
jgi:O-antigen/teichoic acid export membrane protein